MTTLFISHSSHDNAAVVDLRERLRARGFASLFVDFDADDGIPAGADWERELLHKLRLADAVVFVGSRFSAGSEWCLVELAFAHAARRPIFPAALERGVRMASLQSWQWVQLDEPDGFERLVSAIGRRFAAVRSVPWDYTRPPYPGLESFQTADAAVFFGRDDVTAALVERLDVVFGRRRALAVVGASGSGKSSLVRAGLAARLDRDPRWVVLPPFTPGERPMSALTRALGARRDRVDSLALDRASIGEAIRDVAATGEGRHMVLAVVDQAEELLLLSERQERDGLLALLRHETEIPGPLWVVLTLRSEYLDPALRHEGLAELVAEPVAIGALGRSRLPEVILGPARRAGIEYAPGLVERMVDDTRGGDALPLLAYTLRALHDRGPAGPRDVTVDDYEAIGGVDGALRRRADQVLRALDDPRTLPTLLRLVAFGPEGLPGGRRAPLSEFDRRDRTIIDAFVDARLLVSSTRGDTTVVEPAHDALLRAWEPLAQAIESSREQLQALAELRQAADEWSRHAKDDAYLLRGDRLSRARRHAGDDAAVEPTSRALLAASAAAERAELDSAQRRARRLRRLNGALAGLLVIAAAVAAFAVYETGQANARRRDALQAQQAATSRRLASQSALLLSSRPKLALLLALAAYTVDETFEAHNALITAVEDTRRAEMGVPRASGAAISGDESRLVALSRSGDAQLWSIRPRRLLAHVDAGPDFGPFTPNPDGRIPLAVDDSGGVAAAVDASGRLGVWRFDGTSGTFHSVSPATPADQSVGPPLVLGRDGATVAVAVGGDRWQMVDATSGQAVGSAVLVKRGKAPVISNDGRLLAADADDARARHMLDGRIELGEGKRTLGAAIRALEPSSWAELSAKHRWLLSGSPDGLVEVWDVGSDDPFRRPFSPLFGVVRSAGGITAFAPLVDSGLRDAPHVGAIELRRPGRPPATLRDPRLRGHPWTIAFGPGRAAITALYTGNTWGLWRNGPDGWRLSSSSTLGPTVAGALAPDGRHALSYAPPNLILWDLTTAKPSRTVIPQSGSPDSLVFAGDGQRFAVTPSGHRCTVSVYRVLSPQHPVCVPAGLGGGYKLGVALNHDGSVVATSSADGQIAFWNSSTGKRVPVPVAGHSAALASKPLDEFGLGQQPALLAFAPDEHTLLALDIERGTMRFIDVHQQQPVGVTLPGPTGNIADNLVVAFAADGSRLLLASADDEHWFGLTHVSALAWSHDHELFRTRICQLTGDGLTPREWSQLDIPIRYRPQC